MPRHCRLLLIAPAFLLLCPCDTRTDSASFYVAGCDSAGLVFNFYQGHKITGTITDVYNVYQDITNPANSNTRKEYKTILKAVLDLTILEDEKSFEGTATVTWERHDVIVYRQNPGVCADGQNIDSNVRTWTVNIKGKAYCRDGTIGLAGEGTPDGSAVATTLHYHDYGCHTGCPPCYDVMENSKELTTWSSFDEHGFDANSLQLKTNMTVPTPFQGEWYHEALINVE